MKTLELFAIACMACSITSVTAQTNHLVAANQIITKPDGNGYASAVLPDGKILVGGNSPGKTSANLTVVRYNKKGAVDKGFGLHGKAIARFGGNATANSIALQPDGKIIAAGTGNDDLAVARFNADGSIDSSFGKNGKIKRDFEGYQDAINKLILQPDNKILAVGYGFESNHETTKIILMRFNPDGSFDDSFGEGGFTAVRVNENGFDYAWSALLQQDGKILVAGYSYTNSAFDFTLTQFTSNGKVDSAYGTNGHIYTDISGFDLARTMAVQSNGKIVVAGYSDFFNGKFVLARYTKAGLPDSSFGPNGKIITAVGSIDDKAYSVAIQPDDKIVVAGYSYNGSNRDLALVRYNKNGARIKVSALTAK
ncbi:MAG TPA: delta-60 repeat domain-containing protein [Parafilimonas sp.]|nr:delta-60 repeat domain-containing protein [Parafilimonas sp.]